MNPTPKKRSSSSSLESIAADQPATKKHRTELEHVMTFPSLEDDVNVEIPSTYTIDINFGDLAHAFVTTPVPGNDMANQAFDSFFSDQVDLVTVNDTSELSSEDEKSNNNMLQPEQKEHQTLGQVPTSPVNSEDSPSSSEGGPTSTSDGSNKREEPSTSPTDQKDPNQKRQADRAARNRESSRRAREKAKNRFRALENDNMALREMVRRFRMQNEHLLTQLDRANVIQQSCSMCRYNAALAQQPPCGATQSGQMLRQ